MKRFFYILILLLAGLTSTAQRLLLKNLTTFDEKRVHFGFTLGINTFDFKIEHYKTIDDNPNFLSETVNGVPITGTEKIRADISTLTPGFTVGIVTNLRLSTSFDLRFLPGMSFGERKLVYNIPIVDINSSGSIRS
ncbi:MAG: outer membrane beta-barrel protein, partial [Bacteroidota bacterium]|nr:outer membrane beta-barrel protein [Bacteroidota bacterium]